MYHDYQIYNDILLSYSVQCETIIYISKTLYDFTVVIFL